jgi:hypothetical protein
MGAKNTSAEFVQCRDSSVAAPLCEQHAYEEMSADFRVETHVETLGMWIK